MKSLDSFKKAVEPKRRVSKLNKFRNEIFELYDMDYSVSQIQKFLFENEIKISKRRIWDFISKRDVVIKTTTVKTIMNPKNRTSKFSNLISKCYN